MENSIKLEEKLKKLFLSSFLIQKKLPSKEKQQTLLAKLLKQSEKDKKNFISILEKFEKDLAVRADKQLKKLTKIKYKMKKIKNEADFIYERIEMKNQQNDENSILNKLNE